MARVTLALGSFVLGMLLRTVLFGSQTVTFAQSHPEGSNFNSVATSGRKGIELNKEPTIPGLSPRSVGLHVEGATQVLDGLNCEDCSFNNATLQYSGGAVQLNGGTFGGTIRVELSGPAANTVRLVPFLASLTAGHAPEPTDPYRPEIKMITMKNSVNNVAWTAPYDGGQ